MGDKKHGIDQDLIRDLANLLAETELSEIEVEQNDIRIRVTRSVQGVIAPVTQAPVTAAPAHTEAQHSAARESSALAESDPSSHPGAVKSPMVGTVYLAPDPDAKPFVDIGESVTAGQTLMIVEAMKHMNEVPAPSSGTITAIFVTDGQPVEYGEVLLVIE